MERKPKTIFQLESPFKAVQWPEISSQNQKTILELLCSLLSPLGQYRLNHIVASKGKRDKKRKRREAKSGDVPPVPDVPPPHELSNFLAVGLNSVTRILESSSQKSKPGATTSESITDGQQKVEAKIRDPPSSNVENKDKSPANGHFSAIFLCHSSQSTILNEHLLQLVTTASLAYPELSQTRLVELSKGSDGRLCEALGIPRVSFIGILEGAPYSKSLIDLVRECVPEIEIPWLQQAKESKYLPVKINAIETFTSTEKKVRA